MGFVSIEGEPIDLSGAGARLATAGDRLRGKLAGPDSQIAAIEAEQPWGHDDFGTAFLKSYDGAIEGGGPLRVEATTAAAELPDGLTRLGNAVSWAMVSYEATDSEVAADINNL